MQFYEHMTLPWHRRLQIIVHLSHGFARLTGETCTETDFSY